MSLPNYEKPVKGNTEIRKHPSHKCVHITPGHKTNKDKQLVANNKTTTGFNNKTKEDFRMNFGNSNTSFVHGILFFNSQTASHRVWKCLRCAGNERSADH